jgi:hypothetical protein
MLKALDTELTIPQFAKEVGRHPSTIRKAMQYCALPEEIRIAVRKDELPYGLALELVRAHGHPKVDDSEFAYWFMHARVQKLKISEFRRQLTERIKELESQQTSMFAIFGGAEAMMRRKRRQVIDARINRSLDESLGFVFRLNRLLASGELGDDESPYGSGSAVLALQKISEFVLQVTLAMHKHMTRKQRQRIIEEQLAKAEPMLAELREHYA